MAKFSGSLALAMRVREVKMEGRVVRIATGWWAWCQQRADRRGEGLVTNCCQCHLGTRP